MFVSNSPRSIARAFALFAPMAALVLSGCSRDDLAPDCFLIDPDTGNCLVPDPGGTEVGINCQFFPDGAERATYDFTPEIGGGSGNYQMWQATNLPDGLTIDANTGLVSGIPESAGEYGGITISVFDAGKGQSFDAECGPLTINPALSADGIRLEDYHCIPQTSSKDDMQDFLVGGDGTEITCSEIPSGGGASCPIGDGNGRPPPGISFDEDTCTHTGTLNTDRRGTWVWLVEIEQSGHSTRVPFCATNDISTHHEIALTVDGNADDDLRPGLYEYDAAVDLAFGAGTHQWAINDPACPGTDCNNFGFRFNVTCSPFDVAAPWSITLSPSSGTPEGLAHEMSGTGPAPGDSWSTRPFVASFEMSYCTSADGSFCDVNDGDVFEQNAQTKYHFDVIGYPTAP